MLDNTFDKITEDLTTDKSRATIRPLQVVVLFLVRASPKSRDGRASFTIIAIIELPQKFTLNRHLPQPLQHM